LLLRDPVHPSEKGVLDGPLRSNGRETEKSGKQ